MYAIKVGSTAGYKTLAGLQYTPDAHYTTQGATNGVNTVTDPIAKTNDDGLNQNQRYGMFTYDLPVAPAPDCCVVTLNINEQWETGAGQRKMSVAAEGVTLAACRTFLARR